MGIFSGTVEIPAKYNSSEAMVADVKDCLSKIDMYNEGEVDSEDEEPDLTHVEDVKIFTSKTMQNGLNRFEVNMLSGSDVIMVFCHINDYARLLDQAMCELKHNDYVYICLPFWAYMPSRYYLKACNKGIGILKWTPGMVVEAKEGRRSPKFTDLNRLCRIKDFR